MITELRVRRSVWWLRLLLALTAVPAVLAGLLAMHVLSGSSGEPAAANHHSVGFALTSDAHAGTTAAPNDHETSSTGACSADCQREHQMSAAACGLALLVAAFTLAVGAGWFRMGWLLRPIRYLSLGTRSPAEPVPPSLSVLSISRT